MILGSRIAILQDAYKFRNVSNFKSFLPDNCEVTPKRILQDRILPGGHFLWAANLRIWPGAAKSDDEIGDSLTTAQWPAPDLKQGLISRSLIAGAGHDRSITYT